MAYERRAYDVVEQAGRFEVREYRPAIVAETLVEGDFDEVGNDGFRILAAYIFGENEARRSIEMTAPVTQEPSSQKIAMTAPVTQEAAERGYRVTFMMPSEYTLETLPQPKDPRVVLRTEPGGRFASIRYSGFWSTSRYERHLGELRVWMGEQGLDATGSPVWARYDPPWTLWFLRTNEILIPVSEGAAR